MEILAPVGSPECVIPAVRMGANAIYLGASAFSARASASNFDDEELLKAIEYCHQRGVKVYLALNTLIRDDEMQSALNTASIAVKYGIDAIIVQDIGLASLLKKSCPDVKLHASTQMSIHTPEGAKLLYDMGFDRVVLSRELSENEIKEIVNSCPIETEVFVHGALCMSVSGQCYFSAMVGSRSGNRGRCAQPCRLPHCINDNKNNNHALSLKDLTLTDHLKKLEQIGVTSAKIEGRMKRPEYVAASVKACRQALDEGIVDFETKDILRSVFARSGFTDGYYMGKLGPEMFGKREKEDVISANESLFKKIRGLYNKEAQLIPLKMQFKAISNELMSLSITDDMGNTAFVEEAPPEKAEKLPTSEERIREQLSKTGGTPFFTESIEISLDKEPMIRLSSLNDMRRKAIEIILSHRAKQDEREFKMPDIRIEDNKKISRYRERHVMISCDIDPKLKNNLIFVPYDSKQENLKKLVDDGFSIGLELPRGMFGKEKKISEYIKKAKDVGVGHILAGSLGAVALGKKYDMIVHGDFGLNVMNSHTVRVLAELGCADVVASIELTYKQISQLCHHIPVGILSSGYVPLMLTRNCPVKGSGISCAECGMKSVLRDKLGHTFPVVCNTGCAEILNCATLKCERSDLNITNTSFEIHRDDIRSCFDNSKLTSNVTHGLYTRGVI